MRREIVELCLRRGFAFLRACVERWQITERCPFGDADVCHRIERRIWSPDAGDETAGINS